MHILRNRNLEAPTLRRPETRHVLLEQEIRGFLPRKKKNTAKKRLPDTKVRKAVGIAMGEERAWVLEADCPRSSPSSTTYALHLFGNLLVSSPENGDHGAYLMVPLCGLNVLRQVKVQSFPPPSL